MSDQDFFFDDEDEKASKPAGKTPQKSAGKPPAKTGGQKPAAAPAKSQAPAEAASRTMFEQSVSLTVALLIAAAALLLGVIIGVLIPKAGTESVGSPITAPQQTAPPLSPNELNSQQLPPGHPNVGAGGATGSAPATKTK